MKVVGKRIAVLLLVALLFAAVSVPSVAAAEGQPGLIINGQDYQADLYLRDGVSYIAAASLAKIPGLIVAEEGYVPLRSFFMSNGGDIRWDKGSQNVIVFWRDRKDKWAADDLVVESSRLLQEKNTYKMEGRINIKMSTTGSGVGTVQEIPEVASIMEGAFQQEPLAIHVKQTMELPQDFLGKDTEPAGEEQALPGGTMNTEMVWTENKIYQKSPLAEEWIVQELSDADMMGNLTNMLQTAPQQSLEMMRGFGIIYVFGDDAVIDGQDYYTISNYIDSSTFKKVLTEYMKGFDMSGLPGSPGEAPDPDGGGVGDSNIDLGQVFQQLLETMEINYYVDTYINKKTLLTEHMSFDMEMEYGLDETLSPEGAVNVKMIMDGDLRLYDFGAGIQLPDMSDAITQQELLERLTNKAETAE